MSDEMTIVTTPEIGITHLGPNVPPMYSSLATVQVIEGTCVRRIGRYVEPGGGEQSVVLSGRYEASRADDDRQDGDRQGQLREVNGPR